MHSWSSHVTKGFRAERSLLGEDLGEGVAANSTMGAISGKIQSMAAAPMAAHVAKINEHAAMDYSGAIVALLTALPFGSAALIMLYTAKHSAASGQCHCKAQADCTHDHAPLILSEPYSVTLG